MSHDEIKEIINLVRHEMQPIDPKSTDLSENVLLCLRTLGSGSFQNCSKDFLKVTQSTVSKVLMQFVNIMTANASKYIYKPRSRDELATSIKSNFLN